MNRTIYKIVTLLFIVTLAGCAARTVVPKPGNITLENAMQDVGYGLVAMRKAQGDLKTGLIADEVTVTFNISAAGEDTSKLYVELTPILTQPQIGGRAGGEAGTKYTAERGNKIEIKLKNLMTADTSKILNDKAKEQIKSMVDYIVKEGGGSGPVYDQPRR